MSELHDYKERVGKMVDAAVHMRRGQWTVTSDEIDAKLETAYTKNMEVSVAADWIMNNCTKCELTHAQALLADLEYRRKTEIDAFYKEYDEVLEAYREECLGQDGEKTGHFFVDCRGEVFESVVPDYKTVKMQHFGVKTTIKAFPENRRDLSEKRAKELVPGWQVTGK